MIAGGCAVGGRCTQTDPPGDAGLVSVDDRGLALGGFDPVAYFQEGRAVPGSAGHEFEYRGVTYRFASAAHMEAFVNSPGGFLPAFGGFCGYAASVDSLAPADPELWQLCDGRLVLQNNVVACALFNLDAEGRYALARENWPGLVRRRCVPARE